MNKLPPERVCEIYLMLAQGVTISQTALATGACKEAVLLYGNALGGISEGWYDANVEGGLWEFNREVAPVWEASTPEVTVAGWRFRPLTDDTLAEARRFAVAKAKQAKKPESMRHLVALRVCFYVFCEGNPTPCMRMKIEQAPISPETLCRGLLEEADAFGLLSW